MHIEASPQFHANQADDAFIRVGDKSKKLNFEDRMALMYAKGVRYYEDEPVADLDQKLPIDTAKSTDSVINGNDELKNLPIKLSEQSFMQMYSNKGYNEPTILNLRNIYNQVEVNQIFGSSYIVKILDCSERTARNLLTKLKEMGAVITVTGKGKGMYRFKYTEEI